MSSALNTLKSSVDNAAYFQKVREDLEDLNRAKIQALNKDPDAVIAGYKLRTKAAELEKNNFDKEIVNGLSSLNDPELVKVEQFLFGEKMGQRVPPKIAEAEENYKAFENYDWVEIIRVYNNEIDALEKILALEEPLINLQKSGKKALAETQAEGPESPASPPDGAPVDPAQPPAIEPEPPTQTSQPSPQGNQLEDYEELYNISYQGYLARGFAEPNARELAKKYADDVFAARQREKNPPVFKADPSRAIDPYVVSRSTEDSSKASATSSGLVKNRNTVDFLARAEKNRGTTKSLTSLTLGAFASQLTRRGGTRALGPGDSIAEPYYDIDSVVVRDEQPPPQDGSVPAPRQNQSAASESVGAATGALGALASKGRAAVAALGGAAGILINKAYDLIPPELKKEIKKLLLGIGTGFYIMVSKLVGAIGNLLGGGSVATASASAAAIPVGVAGYGSAGSSIFSGVLGGGGIGGGGGASGFFASGAAPVLIATGTVGAATLLTVTAVAGAFVGPEEPQGQGREPAFVVEKIASPDQIKDYDSAQGAVIGYKITITPGAEEFEITSIEDKIRRIKTTDTGVEDETVQTKSLDSASLTHNYDFSITGEKYQDSNLVNTVTVKATDKDGKEIEETASFVVTIGEPKMIGQPYGFPVEGEVTSLDRHYGTVALNKRIHWTCFPMLGSCGADGSGPGARQGGIDIGTGGNPSPVVSTMDGKVVRVDWHDSCKGTIYVQSCLPGDTECKGAGPWLVVYQHLARVTGLSEGDKVFRGVTKLGNVYAGPKEIGNDCWSGSHIHYQTLFAGVNQEFCGPTNSNGSGVCTSNNWGSCVAGKIEPAPPPNYDNNKTIDASEVAPACTDTSRN